jgi:pseudouridine kinase
MTNTVLCVGSTLIDELFICEDTVMTGTTNQTKYHRSIGGVMSNIVYHLTLLGVNVSYLTAIGEDENGRWIHEDFNQKGVDVSGLLFTKEKTGKYVSVLNPDGSLFIAMCADFCNNYINPVFLETKAELFHQASLIITETNLNIDCLEWMIEFARKYKKKLVIEPVSVPKARKLLSLNLDGVFMITPNESEIKSISPVNELSEIEMAEHLINKGIENVWLRKGALGSTLYNNQNKITLDAPEINVIDCNGAGDAALAGWVAAFLYNFSKLDCLKAGHSLAFEVLQQIGAVKTDINKEEWLTIIEKYYPNDK